VKLAALRARASHGAADSADRKEAKNELDGILKEHADLHGDALLLEPLIMHNQSGTKPFSIDPMHCLELNLMKTLWKYSFGDRMTDGDRELVAEYLSEIGLHLTFGPRASAILGRSGSRQRRRTSSFWAQIISLSQRARDL
jgi:hypothetical protein